jgi:predicted DNA-binding ribbon-helix-helix protein
MKERLSLRVEVSRLEKLREVAEERKKTMTQLIEDWIDRLPNPPKADSAH